jgi:hypothetical protein
MEVLMGRKTVLLDDSLIRDLDLMAKREDRDFSSALRYSLRIGLLAIQNPSLTSDEIKDLLEAKTEMEAGDVRRLNLADL